MRTRLGSWFRSPFLPGWGWLALIAGLWLAPVAGQTIWDGGGGSPNDDWGTAGNWNNNILPAFDGADALTFGTGFTSGTTLTLGADRTIGSFTINTITSFSVSGNTLTLSTGSLTRQDVSGTEGSHTISSGILLGTDAAWSINGSGTLTVSGGIGELGGARSLSKSGSATLTLGGAGAYSGSTTVSSGALRVTADGALGSTSAGTLVQSGAALELTGGVTYSAAEALTVSGSGVSGTGAILGVSGNNAFVGGITLAGDSSIGVNAASVLTLSGGVLEDAGGRSLAKVGTGTLVLSAGSAYSGTTLVSAGTLRVSANGALGGIAAGTTVSSGAALSLTGGVNYSDAEPLVITGTGVSSAGALVNFSGANTFAGPITLGGPATVGVPSGTLALGGAIDNSGVLLTVNTSGGSAIFNGSITGAGGLTKSSANGIVTLAAGSDYTGPTLVTGGRLYLQADGALGSTSSGTVVSSFAVLGLDGGVSYNSPEPVTINGVGASSIGALGSVTGNNSFAGPITLGSASTIGAAAGSLTLDGDVANAGFVVTFSTTGDITLNGTVSGSGGLTKSGTGTLTLLNASTYSGPTTIGSSGGLTRLGADGALGDAASGTTVVGGFFGGSVALFGSIDYANPEPITINGGGSDTSIGTFGNESGNNSFAGPITLGSSSMIAAASGQLTLSGGIDTGTFALSIGGSGDIDVQGGIAGSGTVTKTGSGALSLSAASSYSGQTTIQGGTIVVTANDALGSAASGTSVSGVGALAFQGGVQYTTLESLSASGSGPGGAGVVQNLDGDNRFSGNIGLVSNPVLGTAAGSLTLDGVMSGATGFTKTGPATLVLSGSSANTFSGGMTVSEGTLVLDKPENVNAVGSLLTAGDGSGASGSAVVRWAESRQVPTQITVNSDGQLDLQGFEEDLVGTLSLNGGSIVGTSGARLDLGGGITFSGSGGATASIDVPLTLNGDRTFAVNENGVAGDFDLTISGGIADNASGSTARSITKSGSGTLLLNGASTYSGTTDLIQGRLIVGADHALGSAAGSTDTSSGAVLGFIGGVAYSGAEVINLNSGSGNGVENISGLNSFAGSIVLNSGGNLTATSGTLTLSGNLDLGASILTFQGAGNFVIDGGMSGTSVSGRFVKTGSGNLTLNTANSFQGTATINAGEVIVTANDALGTTGSATTVNSGGTLTLDGGVNYSSAEPLTLNGSGSAANGALRSRSGGNQFAGAITVASDSSIAVPAGNLALQGIIANASSTLTLNADGDLSFASAIQGAGVLVKNGPGTVTLSGDNDYSGATTINDGTVLLTRNNALGGFSSGTVVRSGGGLGFSGDIVYDLPEPLSIEGDGFAGAGALFNSFGNSEFYGPIILTADALVASQSGTLTLRGTVDNGGYRLTTEGDGNLTFAAAISGSGGLTQSGNGVVTLSANNSFTGDVQITGGTLLLSGDERIPDGSPVTLAGGTLQTGGSIETLSTLTLSADSTIDFGTGAAQLQFADSSGQAWTSGMTLVVVNWSGSSGGGGLDRLMFGTQFGSVTSSQLAAMLFQNPAGYPAGVYPAVQLSSGEVVPVPIPEAGTTGALIVVIVIAAWHERRWLKKRFRLAAPIMAMAWFAAVDARFPASAAEGASVAMHRGTASYDLFREPPAPETEHFRLGRLRLRSWASTTFEFTDNLNLSDRHPEADLSIEPSFRLSAQWEPTPDWALGLHLGAGYRFYVDHPGASSMTLLPDTHLHQEIQTGPIRWHLESGLVFQTDPLLRPELSGSAGDVARFRRVVSRSSVRASWQPYENLGVTAGYEYKLDRTLNGELRSLDQDEHGVSVGTQLELSPRWKVGPYARYAFLSYPERVQNSGSIASGGLEANWTASTFWSVTLATGYSQSRFSDDGQVEDDSEFRGWTGRLGIQHRISSRLTHSLQMQRFLRGGFGSNYADTWIHQYDLAWRWRENVTLAARAGVEGLFDSGTAGENARRLLGSLGTSVQLDPNWTAHVIYSFAHRHSDLRDKDYVQHRITLNLTRKI